MHQELILYPMLAMVLLTGWVGVRMVRLRVRAVQVDGVNPGYFKLNRGGRLPDPLVQVTQHYENLFESPLLFYAVLILVYVTARTDVVSLALAWMYVGARVVHARVHMGDNELRRRRYAFLASVTLLYALWLWLFVRLAAG